MITRAQLPPTLAAFREVWRGTPFRDYSRVSGPGGGVDCVHFTEAYLLVLGVVDKPLDLPSYSTDWGVHSSRDIVAQYLASNGLSDRFDVLRSSLVEPGDILAFNTGSSIGHFGIAMSAARVLHCWRPKGVIEQGLVELDFFARKCRAKCALEAVYRIRF